jgi:signal transduction histidine kinase
MLERVRIAGELHDTLLQAFTGVVLQLEALKGNTDTLPTLASDTLARVIDQAERALRDTRATVWGLRTDDREVPALSDVFSSAGRSIDGGVTPVRFVERGTPRQLSKCASAALLRIGREAVTNAVKHANAQRVDVEVAYDEDAVRLTVSDDGRGTDTLELHRAATGGHWGVTDMQTRASSAGAVLTIASAPGRGTRVALSIPERH